MNPLRSQICRAARSWKGTPYQHQQRVKGPMGGVDCAMFIAGVALDVELITTEDLKKVPPYPREWNVHSEVPMLTDVMKSFGCTQKVRNTPYPADIVVFKIGRVPSHLGILLDGHIKTFMHALSPPVGRVDETPLEDVWKKRLVEVYKFPGL